jgi:hypothetical protein
VAGLQASQWSHGKCKSSFKHGLKRICSWFLARFRNFRA